MKLRIYITVVSSILLFGMALAHFRNTTPVPGLSKPIEPQFQRLFEQEATVLAERVLGGSVTQWEICDSPGELIVGYATDKHGQHGCTIVYSKRSRQPRSILCQVCDSTPLKEYNRERAQETALSWLKRINLTEGEQWQYLRAQEFEASHYVSYWRSNSFDVILAINVKTGHFISLRINENSEIVRKTSQAISNIEGVTAPKME